jgi:lipoprotein-anchoring transpeptidase ErfK/SrfK
VRSPGAATRRWLVVLLLAVAAIAAPLTGSAKAQKAIVVSISNQMLWAYKGDQVVMSSYVSTGRAGFDTPLGSFAVLSKLPSQTMEGVIRGEYDNVPSPPPSDSVNGADYGDSSAAMPATGTGSLSL